MRIGDRHTQPDLVLATDLDGTFLGGGDDARLTLYRWIEANRDRVGLIFVTGRDLPFIEGLCGDTPVPWPDYVIGDVGATIASVDAKAGRIAPEPELEREIRALWADRGDWVRETLEGAPGLKIQDGAFRHRVSYHYDPETYDPAAITPIEDAGLDCLISAECFFDVLPRGISKGPSLLRLIEHAGVAPSRVLVAGDTMNDFSLFETGLHGVAVGNSEPRLVEALDGRETVHFAEGHGCAGISQAIEAFDFPISTEFAAARAPERVEGA